jgi:hypothetical protein
MQPAMLVDKVEDEPGRRQRAENSRPGEMALPRKTRRIAAVDRHL